MKNNLPNIFLDPKQFDNFDCIHAYEDKELGRVEYCPKSKLEIAVGALRSAKSSLTACGYSEHEVFEALKEIGE